MASECELRNSKPAGVSRAEKLPGFRQAVIPGSRNDERYLHLAWNLETSARHEPASVRQAPYGNQPNSVRNRRADYCR
jgi:hypothetical protein